MPRSETSSTFLPAAITWLLLLFCTHATGQAEFLAEDITPILDVEYVHWNYETAPPADAQWQPITLPFNAKIGVAENTLEEQDRAYLWFRFPLTKPSNDDRYGLYFWRYNLALNVFLNGTEIGGSTFKENRETMSWNRPLLIEIQQGAWQEAGNLVQLRLQRSAWGGALAPVIFGNQESLTELYSARMFRQIEINQVLLAFGISLTLLSFLIWSFRRTDDIYLWFSGLSFFWSIITAHMVIYYNPIPYVYWLPIVHVALDGAILCMYGFIGRLVKDAKRPKLERLFLIWTLLACTSHFFAPREYFWINAYSFHMIGALVLIVILIRVAFIAIKTRNSQAIIITAAMMLQISLFIHNVYLLFSGAAAEWEGSMFYAHYGIPLLFVIFIGTLMRRFVVALRTAEDLNQKLESKVEQSRKIIEKNFAERRALELNQAAEQERQKIYRDLHDDVGSKLLSIIHADRDSRFGSMARGALESLRQAVSRANNPDQPITLFLADIKEETELRLQGSGHEVNWRQIGDTPDLIIPSTIAFNLNRILKEVVSNIIRHAVANEVTIVVNLTEKNWEFTLTDNGKGFDPYGPSGNGLANMQSRALEIGANLSIESEFATGTCVRISSPLPISTNQK